MFFTIKHLGHEYRFKTIKPIQSKTPAIPEIPLPTTKIELMRVIGSLNFYSKFLEILYVNMKPLFNLLHDKLISHWNIHLEPLFQQIRISITKDLTLTLPKTNHPFFKTVDSSLKAIGCV